MTDTSSSVFTNGSSVTNEDQHHSWAGNCSPRERSLCVHALIAAQTAAAPDALSVTQATVSLTYQDLDHRSHVLAHLLQSLRVRPDLLVPLYLNRSPRIIVAAL